LSALILMLLILVFIVVAFCLSAKY